MPELEHDPDDDAFDDVLFRFWIRAASFPGGWPFELAKALTPCETPAEYRAILPGLAAAAAIEIGAIARDAT